MSGCSVCGGQPSWSIVGRGVLPDGAEETVTTYGCMQHVGEISGTMAQNWQDRVITVTLLPVRSLPVQGRQP